MKRVIKIHISLLICFVSLEANDYSFRKYDHVKEFYKTITLDTIAIANEHKLPAASILAIAGLESGYGSGYVSRITGNILSLGAFKGDHELPSVYLPYSKSRKNVLVDPKNIKQCSNEDLLWKKRPKSLKRDYRPSPYAGTNKKLELLLYDKDKKQEAYKACLNDFATRWIVKHSKVKAFRESRVWLDDLLSKNGIEILNNINTNKSFINLIGGREYSYNYRKAWPKKVELIMDKTGLIKLVDDIRNKNMSFEEAWSNI